MKRIKNNTKSGLKSIADITQRSYSQRDDKQRSDKNNVALKNLNKIYNERNKHQTRWFDRNEIKRTAKLNKNMLPIPPHCVIPLVAKQVFQRMAGLLTR